MAKDLETVPVESRASLRAWLCEHHGQSESVWIVRYKKSDARRHVSYDDLVEEALCFGWVDSRPRALDAARSMNLLSPRKPGSAWSKVNKARVDRLLAAGLVAPSGLARIEAARRDGSWTFLDDVDDGVVPEDLAVALKRYPEASSNFDAFPRSSKKIILEWIKTARRAETRRARVEEAATKAQQNIRANHYRT